MPNYKQIFAIQKENEKRVLKVCPTATNESGIYFFYRTDEVGIKHGYVGKAKNLKNRLAQHLQGWEQYIDLSIRKHGLYDPKTALNGYKIEILCHCPVESLDTKESEYIRLKANEGYQLKNKESGGTTGKTDIGERKASKGYRDGLKQGETNIKRKLKTIVEKYLVVRAKNDGKMCEKQLKKFFEILE